MLVFFLCGAIPAASGRTASAEHIEVTTLSSKPNLVSGGDALVQISGAASLMAKPIAVSVNGRDVTAAFHVSPLTRSDLGLVEGLVIGRNRLQVRAGGHVLATLDIINHPITGPVFYSPHQKPFICQTEEAGLGPALDADCSAKTKVDYAYKTTEPPVNPQARPKHGELPPGFKPLNPGATLPDDVADVTLSDGTTMKYIVRRETGTINRGIYQIAFLHQPGTPLPDPWTATPGWNRRLVYYFDGGCSAGYRQGTGANAINDIALSRGYAVAASSLDTFRTSCDDVISAETMAMVKEYFIKRFGVPVHTIGWGGSGGSMQQYLISQNYPGLLDGIQPGTSFPDFITVIPGDTDCSLLAHAFRVARMPWSEDEKTAVTGFAKGQCSVERKAQALVESHPLPGRHTPNPCNAAIPAALIYNPISNPRGTRCDLYDNEVNVFGRDPKTGFARRPLDNVGVQYGLLAFNQGKITADQFLELNEKIGGYDIDGNIVATRTVGDAEALRLAYETGRVEAGRGGLSSIPIIDFRPYLDAVPNGHDSFRSFVVRARLMAANGTAENQVIQTYPKDTFDGDAAYYKMQEGVRLVLMNEWLDNLARDHSSRPILEKIAADKPPGLRDGCMDEDNHWIAETRTYGGGGRCNELYPPHSDPRIAAGAPLTDDILKCALKPVNPGDYKHPLTADQLKRLKAIFPQGVCDYSRPGVGQVPFRDTWKSY